jgi:predicted Rossmann-fold nucleotide-binding protein
VATKAKTRIAVCGPSRADAPTLSLAEQVGAEIAKGGAILVCGGLTVGIVPGTNASDANEWIDVPIVTGMGEARNALVVRSADAVIAIAGSYGTLSEIALALKMGKTVVALNPWTLRAPDGSEPPILAASSAADAVAQALKAIRP